MEFHRLNDEPAADFAALLIHRDAGPGRTLGATALQVGRSESTLRRLANRWRWVDRLQAFDTAVLTQVAESGARTAEDRHRQQLLAYRDAQRKRADWLATAAERLMQLVVESVNAHLDAGAMLQPGQLGAALGSAARALEASGSTAASALGVDELMEQLLSDAEAGKARASTDPR